MVPRCAWFYNLTGITKFFPFCPFSFFTGTKDGRGSWSLSGKRTMEKVMVAGMQTNERQITVVVGGVLDPVAIQGIFEVQE